MKLKDFPLSERPREKALRYGIESLSNSELLAIVLRTGTKDESVIELAMKILGKFDGIHGFSRASYQELIEIKGLKTAKALALLTLIEFARRVNLQSYDKSEQLKSVEKIYHLFEPQLKDEFQEKFIAIYLDNSLRIIRQLELFKGSLNKHLIHPRDIFREAVRLNSAKIIIIHNHPSGDSTPSVEDIKVTKELVKLGEEMGIPILDHIIISKGSYCSIRRLLSS